MRNKQTFTLIKNKPYCEQCGVKGVYSYNHHSLKLCNRACPSCDMGMPNILFCADYTLPALQRRDALVVDIENFTIHQDLNGTIKISW